MANIPRLGGRHFLTDAGLETWLVFKQGFDLPNFSAFVLLETESGRTALRSYYQGFLDLAERYGVGLVLDTPTWRANPDWGAKIGYDRAALAQIHAAGLQMIREMRDQSGSPDRHVLDVVIGPRGDGYVAGKQMTITQARDYHHWQVEQAAVGGADMVCGLTMTYAEEAEGLALAAADVGMPCVISFTVETDGRLPSGMDLAEAVRRVDDSAGDIIAYHMINCAHPSHFAEVLADSALAQRIGGIRANASRMSHAELDEAAELDEGNPDELGQDYRRLLAALPNARVLGGCCGTDHRHVAAIATACLA